MHSMENLKKLAKLGKLVGMCCNFRGCWLVT